MTIHTSPAIGTKVAVAALVAVTLAACGSREPGTDAERLARGKELVQQMSAHLAKATALTATTTEQRDVVRPSGKTERVELTGAYTLRRPDRFHAKVTGTRGAEFWYDGKSLTVALDQHKVFAQAAMPETADRAFDAIAERYDINMPLSDLFRTTPDKALIADTTTGGYAGKENVGATACHHLAFKDLGVEWELWLPVDGDPLPKRIKVLQTARKGKPMADVTFTAWTLAPQLADATFTAQVPAGYEGIAMLQRAAAVKNAPPQPAAEPAPPATKK